MKMKIIIIEIILIIQINKKSLNNKKNEEDDNTNVRDKEDFYSLDVHNSSGRKVNENDN